MKYIYYYEITEDMSPTEYGLMFHVLIKTMIKDFFKILWNVCDGWEIGWDRETKSLVERKDEIKNERIF